MQKRYVAIWFTHLTADWTVRRCPELKAVPFVLKAPERGRMVVKAANKLAQSKGINTGMVVADCKSILPELHVIDDIQGQSDKLLGALAVWCIRYTPVAAVDTPDGLILDVTGCPHLWGGEQQYLNDIIGRLKGFGYNVRAAMADTIGTAWAVSHYGASASVIEPHQQLKALLSLPSASLRLEPSVIDKLNKLGLDTVSRFIQMPRRTLQRRFGTSILNSIDFALGQQVEVIEPVEQIQPYTERMPSIEPIQRAAGIEIALKHLLEQLCKRLQQEELGLRTCIFKCYRLDGNIQQIQIGTTRPTRNVEHVFKLLEVRICMLEPGLGIELFTLEATKVEELSPAQDALWGIHDHDNVVISELLDKIAGKVGMGTIHRYLPDEHYWPERSYKQATTLSEQPSTNWREEIPRPLHLLPQPEPIKVAVELPDNPPMLFRYNGELHNIKKADGPERIEQEWWIADGLFRDYYCVEDEQGRRYWLFRSGHYSDGDPEWFIHGFFA